MIAALSIVASAAALVWQHGWMGAAAVAALAAVLVLAASKRW